MKILMTLTLFTLPLIAHAKFSSEDGVSINLTGGNSNLKTYAFSSNNKYQKEKNSFTLKGAYNYGETNELRSAENWNALFQYSRSFEKKLGLIAGELVESDRFAGVDKRYNSDLGLKYTFSETEDFKFFSEFGYRYTVEKSTDPSAADRKDSKGRLYLESEKNWEKNVDVKFWVEYLPNFTESTDWQLSLEPSLITTLNSVFSLKSAYLWKYDNFPAAGNGNYDYNYTLTLIAKF